MRLSILSSLVYLDGILVPQIPASYPKCQMYLVGLNKVDRDGKNSENIMNKKDLQGLNQRPARSEEI
jgi:hypothetical protein